MPFKSDKQRKACFASNGFNGKIDCHKWAKEKKEKGGSMYRPKKMQTGGSMPSQENYPDYESWQQAMHEWMIRNQSSQGVNLPIQQPDIQQSINDFYGNFPQQQQTILPVDRIQQGIQQGIIEGPQGRDAQQYYSDVNSPIQRGDINWQNVGIGMMRGRNLLSEISGRVARKRQNQYDYEQQTALGQMNAMPASSFQPSPYQLYAKYGGSLKKYQTGGRTPIQVNDKNDPRLRAYNDSLALYNATKGNIDLLKQAEKSPDFPQNWNETTAAWDQKYKEVLAPAWERLKELNGRVPSPVNIYRSDKSLGSNAGEYAKPVQKVVYTPEKQKKGREPIIVDNPNDPRLRAYQDSLRMYNRGYKDFDKGLASLPAYSEVSDLTTWPGKIKPIRGAVFDNNKAAKMVDYTYLADPKDINIATSLQTYKKPVQPVVYNPEPKFKPVNNPRFQGVDLSTGASPNVAAPNMSQANYDSSKPTNYSFTYPTGPYNEQKTIYSPDAELWREMLRGKKVLSSQEIGKSGTATGYMKRGGKSNKYRGKK